MIFSKEENGNLSELGLVKNKIQSVYHKSKNISDEKQEKTTNNLEFNTPKNVLENKGFLSKYLSQADNKQKVSLLLIKKNSALFIF